MVLNAWQSINAAHAGQKVVFARVFSRYADDVVQEGVYLRIRCNDREVYKDGRPLVWTECIGRGGRGAPATKGGRKQAPQAQRENVGWPILRKHPTPTSPFLRSPIP